MNEPAWTGQDEPDLLALYDRALPDVYGYLLIRCGSTATAEDLTAETFLAAVTAVRAGTAVLSVAWLIGIARHKLIDHWRARSREQRHLETAYDPRVPLEDSWDERPDPH
ncbi:MAG TPA: RNA polymerase sigma factor [Trebonia sp.]